MLRPDIIQVWYAVLVYKFTCLIDNTSLPIGLPPVLEYRRDQRRCGKRSSGLWSAEYLEFAEKLRIFRRPYIVYVFSIGAKINDLGWPWRAITHCVSKHVRLSEPTTKIWMKIDPYYQRRRCGPMTLDSGDIRFMRIFPGVLWTGGVKRQWGNRKRQFSGILDTTSSAP